MDKIRREKLQGVIHMLMSVAAIVEQVCDKEQDCVDNYPENLQGTERFEQMEVAVDNLNDALEKIEAAEENIAMAIR